MYEMEVTSSIFETMRRCWNRQPGGVAQGSDRTGVCAALWEGQDGETAEVHAEANLDYHIACLQMVPLEAEFFVDGRLRSAGHYAPGNVSFLRSGEAPRAVMRGRFSCMHIYVPPELLCDVAESQIGGADAMNIELIDCIGRSSPSIMRIGQDLLTEMRTNAAFSRLRIDSLGLDFAVQTLRHHSTFSANRVELNTMARGRLAAWQVRRVTELLAADPAAEHSLAALALQVGLSTFHFARAFKKSLGVPPHQYQMQLRIERAQTLLADTRQSITEIAHSVGYESSQGLARAFHSQIGCTPSEFRKNRL
jgi:AraC family transcriptional regulator